MNLKEKINNKFCGASLVQQKGKNVFHKTINQHATKANNEQGRSEVANLKYATI